jgi:hypothetical protein
MITLIKFPSNSDKNKEIKSLGYWCSSQQDNYKKCLQIMKNKEIYNKWTQFINKYKEYFISNEEIWYDKLDKVIVYIDANKKRPSENDKNNDIKSLGKWVTMQNFSSKKKVYIMKNKEIYDKWINFINDPNYKVYFE